jgi:adenosylmethionine-8-amino-7-oxononanoate aminotransferase
VLDIRRCGLMVGIELVQDRETGTPFPPERRLGHQVTLAARKRGVIIRPLGDVVVLMPAPAMPETLLERLCDATFEAIDEAVAAG